MSHRIGIGICLTLSVLFFADGLIGDRNLTPSGQLYEREPWRSESPQLKGDPIQQYDTAFQFYPWAHYFRESMSRGEFPLWNPYNYLGTPFLANPQTALLFPLTWLHLLFPLQYSFTLIAMLKLALALTGMHLWLQSGGLRASSCLLGAAVFALSMHTVAGLAFPYSSVAVLTPWLMLALRRLVQAPSNLRLLCLAAAATAVVTAGQPQSALAAFLLAGLLTAWETLGKLDRALRWSIWTRIAAAFGLAALFSAPQWIPSFEYAAESMIPEGPRIFQSGLPYWPGNLANFLIPDFFGTPLGVGFWGFPGYNDTAFYSSLAALLLAPFAFLGIRRRWKGWGAASAAAGGLLALGLMLGLAPFESVFELPGFEMIRRNKFVFILIFALAELAARGLDRIAGLEERRVKGFRTALAATGLLLAAAAVAALVRFSPYLDVLDPGDQAFNNAMQAGAFAAGALALLAWRPTWSWTRRGVSLLILAELAVLSFPLNPRGEAGTLYPYSRLVGGLREAAAGGQADRQALEGLSAPSTLSHASVSDRPSRNAEAAPDLRIFSLHTILQPNSALVYRLQDVRCYDVMTPRRLFRFMQAIDPDLGDAWTPMSLLDRDSIHPSTRLVKVFDEALQEHGEELRRYLERDSYWSVGISSIDDADLFELLQIDFLLLRGGVPPKGFRTIEETGPVRIYRNSQAQRARLYHQWVEVEAEGGAEPLKSLDLSREAAVEASLPPPGPPPAASGSIRLLESGSHRRRYQVETQAPAVLVEFERLAPGWKARVDGDPVELFYAQHVFRGLFLEAGRHEVVLEYRPDSLRRGIRLCLAGIVLAAGLLIAGHLRRAGFGRSGKRPA